MTYLDFWLDLVGYQYQVGTYSEHAFNSFT